jgi:S1-C subfamily serine protease
MPLLFAVLLLAQITGPSPAASPATTVPPEPMRMIDPFTARSLFLTVMANGKEVGSATGFVVANGARRYLITNGHVVSGKNPATGKLILPASPTALRIQHHGSVLGRWSPQTEPLFNPDGSRRWLEHPAGRSIDVIALPLTQLPSAVTTYPFDVAHLDDSDMQAVVAMPVSIIGFPLGLVGPERFPIWKTGHIASDPDLDFEGKPAFLLDATTRGGMSGSPVVLRAVGSYRNKDGGFAITTGGASTRFLGIYSGRLHKESEIGIVWRPEVIPAILATAKEGPGAV